MLSTCYIITECPSRQICDKWPFQQLEQTGGPDGVGASGIGSGQISLSRLMHFYRSLSGHMLSHRFLTIWPSAISSFSVSLTMPLCTISSLSARLAPCYFAPNALLSFSLPPSMVLLITFFSAPDRTKGVNNVMCVSVCVGVTTSLTADGWSFSVNNNHFCCGKLANASRRRFYVILLLFWLCLKES